MNDNRVYYECNICAYGVSGEPDSPGLDNKLDKHEDENPGHRMMEVKEEEEGYW